ncbi:MAG: 5-deoxy-glucuronate isomerase [Nostocoides sp.]
MPLGTASTDGYDVRVEAGEAAAGAWRHTGLGVLTLVAGEPVTLSATHVETMVVPLSGSLTVRTDDWSHDLAGRADVWTGPTDVAYLPPSDSVTLTSVAGARVALCRAPLGDAASAQPAYVPSSAVPVELRGAGIASREVRNFGVPGVLEAGRLIACEVITPAGNWSSWPPHKHDEDRPGEEAELEEIYYFETRSIDERGEDPVGYQRVYGSAERPIDVLAEVRSGDVVLVPHGWHGPAMAAPDADLYYLNVMAGPGPERAWLICDDPAHAWVRQTWDDQPVDPRLPMTPHIVPAAAPGDHS